MLYSERELKRQRLMSAQYHIAKRRRIHWHSRSKKIGTSVSKAFTDAIAKLEEMSHDSRNKQFHKLFTFVPADETIVVSYSCALLKDIMLHGRLFISQNWICFHSHIFMFESQIAIQMSTVSSITKERIAFIIPNAIGIHTENEKYIFGSLLSRQSTYAQLITIWRNAAVTSTDLEEEQSSCTSQECGQLADSEGDFLPRNERISRLVLDGDCLNEAKTRRRNVYGFPTFKESNNALNQSAPPKVMPAILHLMHKCKLPKFKCNSSQEDLLQPKTRSRPARNTFTVVFTMKMFQSMKKLSKMVKAITPAQLFLILTACLIMCLTLSAVILTYRVARLQPQLHAGQKRSTLRNAQTVSEWNSLWWSQQAAHTRQIANIWRTITDNLRVLKEMQASLQELHGSEQQQQQQQHKPSQDPVAVSKQEDETQSNTR